jgi:rhamnose utilization protein RhaD (predicted bifunctional aldolase and dehydrogenase)
MDITDLIEVSRRYGADDQMVLAGGGNTSKKLGGEMYVKASGHMLADIDASGFVRMDLSALEQIWDKEYPEDTDERENRVLADMMEARFAGEQARPSVEALLHSLLRPAYVVHLHPGLVNGVTCAQDGEQTVHRFFGDDAVWIPLVNPGYILAKTVRDAIREHEGRTGVYPASIFLQNHGVFVSADTLDEIDRIYDRIMSTLTAALKRTPQMAPVAVDPKRNDLITEALNTFAGTDQACHVLMNEELSSRLQDEESFYPLSSAFTPDHIVYSGFKPLWIDHAVFSEKDPVAAVVARCKAYEEAYGVAPKCLAVQHTGIFALEERAVILFQDTVKVAAYTESFGGARFMDDDQISFIRNWEVEKYRAKVS